MRPYEIRQCQAPDCQFRYPTAAGEPAGKSCPLCAADTTVAAQPYTNPAAPSPSPARYQNLELVMDNIRSLYNVGAIMRTADGAGIRHLHLGGITATPEHPKLGKTALGAERALPWTYYRNGVEAVARLKSTGYEIWTLEEVPDGEDIFRALFVTSGEQKRLLVIGNEKVGVDPAILKLADRTFFLPMRGVKTSLNVAVAFGIAIYQIQFS